MTQVGIVQFDIQWQDVGANLEKVRKLTSKIRPETYDLIILPELWSFGFAMNRDACRTFESALNFMTMLGYRQRSCIMGGLPRQVPNGQENRCYLVGWGHTDYYAKIKLFKYADEDESYRPGYETRMFYAAGFQICPLICYDLRFPELPRSMIPEANLITYIANWPEERIDHWRTLLVARAIENQTYVIGVNRIGTDGAGLNYPGASMVVSPTGEVLLDCGDQEGVFSIEIEPEYVKKCREKWPFLKDKDDDWSPMC